MAVGDPEAAGEEKLDEKALKSVAAATGGNYYRAEDRDELEGIYKQLDSLDTRDIETETYRRRRELYFYPLGAAIILSLAFVLLTLWFSYARPTASLQEEPA